jgi:tetratricopeptide (TPR) repeat protein
VIEPEDVRQAARRRLFDYYVHAAHAAAVVIDAWRKPLVLDAPDPMVTVERFSDLEQARTWLTVEVHVLLAIVRAATDARFDSHVWALGWSLSTALEYQGYWEDLVAVQHARLDAARRQADRGKEAAAHRVVGRSYAQLDRYDEAHHHHRLALDLFRALGDNEGLTGVYSGAAAIHERQGQLREAMSSALQALEFARKCDRRDAVAYVLGQIGTYAGRLGDHKRAIRYCREARRIHFDIGNRIGEASMWHSLGIAHHQLAEYRTAEDCFQESLRLVREVGDRFHTAMVLADLGDTRQADGGRDGARGAWQQALEIFDELGHPDAERVRAKLGELVGS